MKIYKIYLLFAIVLIACSMSDTKIYTLKLMDSSSVDAFVNNVGKKPIININIESPRHLTQPYIITRYSDYQVAISKYSKWEASPRDMISKKIKKELESINVFKEVNISNINDSESYSLNLDLRRFELLSFGNENHGEILLIVDLVAPDGKKLYSDRIFKRIKLKSNNFDELAESLSIAINDLLGLIKNEIIKSISN